MKGAPGPGSGLLPTADSFVMQQPGQVGALLRGRRATPLAQFVPGHHAGRLPCTTTAGLGLSPVGTSRAPCRITAGSTFPLSP